jgi:hypothetical protein
LELGWSLEFQKSTTVSLQFHVGGRSTGTSSACRSVGHRPAVERFHFELEMD